MRGNPPAAATMPIKLTAMIPIRLGREAARVLEDVLAVLGGEVTSISVDGRPIDLTR